MLEMAGAHRLVTIDMHSSQVQGTFHGPFDHLIAERLILDGLKTEMGDRDPELLPLFRQTPVEPKMPSGLLISWVFACVTCKRPVTGTTVANLFAPRSFRASRAVYAS